MKRFLSGILAVAMTLSVYVTGGVPEAVMACDAESIEVEMAQAVTEDEWQEPITEIGEEFVDSYTSGCFRYTINADGTATIVKFLPEENVDETVVIPGTVDGYTVTTVDKEAFMLLMGADYTMKQLVIPASVTSFEYRIAGYNRLEEFVVEEGNNSYKSVDGVVFTIDGRKLVAFPPNKEVDVYEVPESVVILEDDSFRECCAVNEVIIPRSLESIGNYAFYSSDIKKINIGRNVESIGVYAFAYTKNLERVVLPSKVTDIEEGTFHGSGVKHVEFLGNVESFGAYAFSNSHITAINIPATVNNIGLKALAYCYDLEKIVVEEGNAAYRVENSSLLTMDGSKLVVHPRGMRDTIYTVPEGVQIIEAAAFAYDRNLQYIKLPYGLTTIKNGAFDGCYNLKEMDMPHTVNYLGMDVFYDCKALETIIVSSSLYTIPARVFSGCTGLKSVFIPAGVGKINEYAFENCSNLEEIYFVGNKERWKEINAEGGNPYFEGVKIHYLDNLKNFVDRLYTVALGRKYDLVGLDGWVQHLVQENHDGAGLAKEFILGPEFALRGLTDEQYIDVLYKTFFNREADEAGKELWLATLASGASREYVLSQFVNLDEFTILCSEYNINRGVMFADGSVAAPGLPQFVSRLYEHVLGRGADSAGLYAWTAALKSKELTAEAAAVNFFNSEEYALKNVDSAAFVTDCYSVFMDREADADGLAYWVSCLDDYGVSREWVISEFAKSVEFKEIAAKYGL